MVVNQEEGKEGNKHLCLQRPHTRVEHSISHTQKQKIHETKPTAARYAILMFSILFKIKCCSHLIKWASQFSNRLRPAL